MIPNLAEVLRLLLVTDDRLVRGRDLVGLCQAAERGGVTAIQLRLKEAVPRELVSRVRAVIGAVSIPVLVNDRVDVALAGGAAGVHLGPDDVPVELARRVVPPGFIVGTSVGAEAEMANGEQADYWGIGPYRATGTKYDAGTPLGAEGLRQIVRRARSDQVCVAIGGVIPEDMPAILSAGARGVAVVSGILGSENVEDAARRYGQALETPGTYLRGSDVPREGH